MSTMPPVTSPPRSQPSPQVSPLFDELQFIGRSPEMVRIFSTIEKLAQVDTSVLIRGESGTGKELVANAIHRHSLRKEGRFVAINCSAIPENLIESELFGHEKGAFTGADTKKIGKFQYADGGTLFLDEIGDTSPLIQVKLLRAIQQRCFTPVGSTKEISVNVRLIAATNRPLEQMMTQGRFREDLFYRLNVLPVFLPALRQRPGDLDLLVSHFVRKFSQLHRKPINSATPEFMRVLKSHSWPGNIRELENVIEHAFVLETGPELSPSSLPDALWHQHRPSKKISVPDTTAAPGEAKPFDVLATSPPTAPTESPALLLHNQDDPLDFKSYKDAYEKRFLIYALKVHGGKINQTALKAKIPKKTLLRKLAKFGIKAKDYSTPS